MIKYMDNRLVTTIGVVVLILVAIGAYFYGVKSSSRTMYTTTTVAEIRTVTVTSTVYAYATLSPVEVEAIKYMAEEEKLAYDVYTKLAKIHPNVTVFANIAKSKRTQVNSVLALTEKVRHKNRA